MEDGTVVSSFAVNIDEAKHNFVSIVSSPVTIYLLIQWCISSQVKYWILRNTVSRPECYYSLFQIEFLAMKIIQFHISLH